MATFLTILIYSTVIGGAIFVFFSKTDRKKRKNFSQPYQRRKKNFRDTYHKDYLKSEWWKYKKMTYFITNEKACAVCGYTKGVQLHHTNYNNLANEEDTDLVALCRRHHLEFHASGKPISETRSWVMQKRLIGKVENFLK